MAITGRIVTTLLQDGKVHVDDPAQRRQQQWTTAMVCLRDKCYEI